MNLEAMVPGTEERAPARRGLELRKQPGAIVGGLPTVSLMPRELRDAAREKSLRRYLVLGVATALVVAAAATAGATVLAGAAQGRLDAENAETQTLVSQLGRFRDVQVLQQDLAVGNAAVDVASSTEIDWQAQIGAVTAAMPAGFTITSIQGDSATVMTTYGQGSSPLEKPRAATISLSVATSDIRLLPRWLRLLRQAPAYADASASVVSGGADDYTVQLLVHLSPKALVSAGKAAK